MSDHTKAAGLEFLQQFSVGVACQIGIVNRPPLSFSFRFFAGREVSNFVLRRLRWFDIRFIFGYDRHLDPFFRLEVNAPFVHADRQRLRLEAVKYMLSGPVHARSAVYLRAVQ